MNTRLEKSLTKEEKEFVEKVRKEGWNEKDIEQVIRNTRAKERRWGIWKL